MTDSLWAFIVIAAFLGGLIAGVQMVSSWVGTDEYPASEWVPVGKAMPRYNVEVLVWWGDDERLGRTDTGWPVVGYWARDGSWREAGNSKDALEDVTHWMTLPKAPNE